jgi:23S rRNA (guanosine2251-2'-O)-methyltransferase
MRLNYRERQARMREIAEAGWQGMENLPESVRERADLLPRMPIEIIACPLGKAVNHGGLLRMAEAFRLEMVTFSFEQDRGNDFSGHRGAIRWQPYRWLPAEEAVAEATTKGRQKIALALSDSAVNFEVFEYQFPMSLVVGSEIDGVPQGILDQCDACVAIPMFGLMESLNVATATAIVVQHITSQYAKETGYTPLRDASKRLLKV